jgi:two-component system LytT family sensor kinase
LLVWTLIGSVAYARHYLQDPTGGPASRILYDLCTWLTCFYPWAALSPVVFRLERRYPLASADWPMNLAKLALPAAPLALLGIEIGVVLSLLVDFVFGKPIHLTMQSWRPEGLDFLVHLLIYGGVVLAACVIRKLIELREREREAAALALEKAQLEASLRQAELEALRMRLNPHFLFNCLQNISVLAQDEPKTASQMLTRLGELLRTALRNDSQPETTLAAEIALTKSYVAVEGMRFGDRLSVVFDFVPEADQALVPTFLLQPLVENAIHHGLKNLRQTGAIFIRGSISNAGAGQSEGRKEQINKSEARSGDCLVLTVTDNGVGLPESMAQIEPGIGLTSVSERLARMYPDQHSFSIRALAEGGTEVVITIPLHFAPSGAQVISDEQTSLVDRR